MGARARKNLTLIGVIAGVAAIVTAAFVFRPDQADHGTTGDTTSTTGAGDPEAVLAELAGVPVTVYGDSLAALGTFYTAGRHWSDLLSAGTDIGPLTNRGIGGSTMEQTTNVVGGGTPLAWTKPAEPTCVIVMSVLNSTIHPSDAPGDVPRSTESLKAAATSIAAILLSDAFGEDRTDLSAFTGTWDPYAGVALAGGSIAHSTAGTVTFTVPPGYAHRQLWMATLAGALSSTYQIERNGERVGSATTPFSEIDDPVFSKYLVPIGKVDSGDVVTVQNAFGDFWYDGMYIDSGINHVVLATEGLVLPGTVFGDADLNAAHNDAIRDAAAEINALVPDGASVIDIAGDGFDQDSMTIADRIHPNDAGQQWVFEAVLRGLTAHLPITPRLGA
jgi:hypothetical protein